MSKASPKPPPTARKRDPSFLARSLADRVILFRFSVLLNIALALYIVLQPHLIIAELRVPQRAIILDGAGSFSVSPLVELSDADALHRECAVGAIRAAFERNPVGPDRPAEVERWFTQAGRDKVAALVTNERREFREKQFFQKVVITSIETTATGRDTFAARAKGQLIRTGVLNDRAHIETVDFDLQLPMVVNPDMVSNKRYPYASWDLDIEYSR